MKPAITICADSQTPFAAALSLFTEIGCQAGILQQGYPLEIDGRQYASAGEAYLALSQNLDLEQKFEVMLVVLRAKLEQESFLSGVIAASGGILWLRTCSYYSSSLEPATFWNGKGYNSPFITALIVAYRQVNDFLLKERGMTTVDDCILDCGTQEELEPDLFDGDRQSLTKLLSYNPVSREMFVFFNDKQKAREWGGKLIELDISLDFSIEAASSKDWKFELVLPMVNEVCARRLANSAKFNRRPHAKNPRPQAEMGMSATLGKK